MFEEVLNKIEHKQYREFAEELLKGIPEYFYKVPASSTGKYHPTYALGDGGLYRHTLAACRILEYLMESNRTIDDEFKDCMRIAMMMHDTFKSGSQEEYENDPHTKHEHPILAAEYVESVGKKYNVCLGMIIGCIKSHMGKWNTSEYSDVVLPKPMSEFEILCHSADFLASRKDIEVRFGG